MRRLLSAVAAAGLLLLAGSVPVRSAEPKLLVGAAVVDITPPAFNAAKDAVAFPLCPAAVFDGPRLFALQEPYTDVNGSGFFNYPEPFCDANANTKYDGLYLSGGVDHLARRVHDPIDARATAFSDGTSTVVVVSVVAQGLFENYTREMRAAAKAKRAGITDVLVSANHNESSPDSVGIYGAPSLADVAGARSGIDEYYADYLVERVATAAAAAYDARVPATLHVGQFLMPPSIDVHLSHNFPTTDDKRNPAATDPKVGLLQARDSKGRAIVTLMSLAAHNQQIGHSGYAQLGYEIGSDWPGYFHRRLTTKGGFGMPVFLVGDNGSIEDPWTVPEVDRKKHPECEDGCYAQTQATGERLADIVAGKVAALERVRPGRVRLRRSEFFVPLENNIFKVAAAGGLFGERQTYIGGVPAAGAGTDLRTSVAVVDVGPDLQLLANPGEAFPALTVGSHWGIDEVGCPERPNPPTPTWHARAAYRFQVGLADDLIGYELPPWAFTSIAGVYPSTCYNDSDDIDPAGHQHKLETEGVGPTGSKLVAEQLTALLKADTDPKAKVVRGRFVQPDGSLTRRPEKSLAVLLESGEVLSATPGLAAFGSHAVQPGGSFIDFDGTVQGPATLQTRGVRTADGRRYYLDVYPAMAADALGAAMSSHGDPCTGFGSCGDNVDGGSGDGDDDLASTGGLPFAGLALALGVSASVLLRRRRRTA
jgi:hypothetical protein